VIGAEVLATGMGAQWTGRDLLIVEADESDGTHEALPLHGTIITNIDRDHLDYFGSLDGEYDSFLKFAKRVMGPVVLCADDVLTSRLGEEMRRAGSTEAKVFMYGFDDKSDARISMVKESTTGSTFVLSVKNESATVTLPSFGMHNVLNATAALSMATLLGVPLNEGAASLAHYGGVERRFQVRGVARGTAMIDDYAHLPAEIEAALAATRQRYPGKRVIAVFQPNRYHRIQAMANEYASCFRAADHVVITDVYASGTPRIEGVTGKLVVDAVVQHGGHENVTWCETRDELVAHIVSHLGTDSVCVSMGCGDIELLPAQVLAAVKLSETSA
jgi:UDP-N-acetylmuramate--alanine ligase